MRNESVAILDIRSNEVSFLIGARGVNNTFVFKGMQTEKYNGYSLEKGFTDKESFQRAVERCVSLIQKNYEGAIREIFVGVPSGNVTVLTKGHMKSYSYKRKISLQDIDALYESGLNELMASGKYIRRSSMYFTLGDNRKYFTKEDLCGISTTMLKGGLCYYFTTEEFYDSVEEALKPLGFTTINYIPSTLAQTTYLFPRERREGYVFLLDIGFYTSSITVLYGNGIVHEETYDNGIAFILKTLKEAFGINDSVAMEMLLAANISCGPIKEDESWTSVNIGEKYLVEEINNAITFALSKLCEKVAAFFNKYYEDKNILGFETGSISITGEGVGMIKGVGEYVSKHVGMLPEVVTPDLPYYDKPMFSSRIALLDMALSDKEKKKWVNKIFECLGGNKKW